MPKRLSQREIERYRRDGFVLPVRVLSLQRAGAWRREREAAEASMGGAIGSLARTKFSLRSPWAGRLAATAAILDAVEDLIAPDIILYEKATMTDAGFVADMKTFTLEGGPIGRECRESDEGNLRRSPAS